MMGEALPGRRPTTIRTHVVDAAGSFVELILKGEPSGVHRPVTSDNARLTLTLNAEQACGWTAVNVRDGNGTLLLVGNPIYLSCDTVAPR